jgi:hypothetical protein
MPECFSCRARQIFRHRQTKAATDNLTSLHDHEEGLRSRSLAAIKADAALSDHWDLAADAMNAIYAFSHDHPHGSEDELTLQYLGIRLFNAAGVSVKLALSGYYQKAFDQVRDVIETYFLVARRIPTRSTSGNARTGRSSRGTSVLPASATSSTRGTATRAASGRGFIASSRKLHRTLPIGEYR